MTVITDLATTSATTARAREGAGLLGSDGLLRSASAALDVLDCFTADEELGVSDIARRLAVAKSTAHRLLSVLCSRGLAEQNPITRQYRLGLHILELGQIAHSRMELLRAASPMLVELREVSRRTVLFSVADGADVLEIERLASVRGNPLLARAGRRWPAHCTSSGKAIAAHDPALAAARRDRGFPASTEQTIGTAQGFERALVDARRNGFATDFDEALDGASSVSSPVLDRSGIARAAVSLLGPTPEVRQDLGRASRLVFITARKIAQRLSSCPLDGYSQQRAA